jgi:triosephosphate isomerase
MAGNWKMHKTVEEAEEFVAAFLPKIFGEDRAEVVLCAPFTALTPLVDSTRGSRVKVAAQNMHFEQSGAFTGEVSAPMLAELEVSAVVIGHSERREYFGETDEALAKKVPAALAAGIEPILCVGESDAQREAGETEAVLTRQIQADMAELPAGRMADIVIAYEPIWAIGTGKVATTEQAQEACAFIRSLLSQIDAEGAQATRILYGGSVKPDNVAELLAQPDIDGALVGGASLDAAGFAEIVAAGDAA